MRRMATFVACGPITADSGVTVEVHAGVRVELISGGAPMGTNRSIVRSILTGETFRVRPFVIEIGEHIVDCDCL